MRYVYDSGEIWRLTERRYRSFLKDGSRQPFGRKLAIPDVADYGTRIGPAFNVTNAGPDEFAIELANVGLIDLAAERGE